MTLAIGFDGRVAALRRFNRFYTQRIGVLREGLHDSPFSLTEARVLYELAHRDGPTASALSRDLALDPGYLSRILRGFRRQGLIERRPSPTDARQSHLWLTAKGRAAFAPLDARSREDNAALLSHLSEPQQQRLIEAVGTIETLLGAARRDGAPSYLLRPHQPGDIGWIIQRHGALYAQEYGWDASFEALVAEIAAAFLRGHDPAKERCWIAEKDGVNAGCVMLVRKSRTVAQLRLLLVEPQARGLGIGRRLVGECIRFARGAGYRRVVLWTNSVLHAARRLYQEAGFRLVEEAPHHSFGHDLVGQTWELRL